MNVLDCNAPDAVWTCYLETYVELEYTSMDQVGRAEKQLLAFYDWTEGKFHREFIGCFAFGSCVGPALSAFGS